jgi:uncharacterized protein DUF1905
LPLSFEANQGQTNTRVKFLSRGAGYTLFLTGDEAVLKLRGSKPDINKTKIAGTTHNLQHMLPVRVEIRRAIGKEVGKTVKVVLEKRIRTN